MAGDLVDADRRMSDVEALMWNLEKDPYLSASIANVTLLDRPPDRRRLEARLARAVDLVPRLRQRVVPGFGRLAPPEWRDDPDFDLAHHLRWIALPEPGSDRQLLDLATTVVNDPFDRTRPLWEFVVVEGLSGRRAAMVQKLHHTITDGEGGVRLSAQFIDVERDAEHPIAGPLPPPVPRPAAEPVPGFAATVTGTLGHNVRRLVGVARRSAGDAVGLAAHPSRLLDAAPAVADGVRSAAGQLLVVDRARSPLWIERSLRRRLETLQVPLEPARAAAHALGGTINDLFVCAAAGAAGAYHRDEGHDVDELRISMPVSTRRDRSSGGNAFTPTRTLVPVGPDPVARFDTVRERLRGLRGERSIDLAEPLAGLVNLLPTSAVVRAARRQVATVDFATSNVRGAPFDLYLAGAKIGANYPIGPTGGTAFNLTLLSSAGSLDMGLNVDLAAVADPDRLRRRIEEAFEELLALG